jgi:hypothetical protein
MDKYWDNRDIPLQSGCRLETNEIERVIEASIAGFIPGIDPLFPNDGEQRSTGGDTLIYRLAKVATGLDCSDVHDDRLFAELFDEIIEKPPCFAFGVIPTVTDENCAHSSNL